MPLIVDGVEIERVVNNGSDLNELYHDGVLVWQRVFEADVTVGSAIYFYDNFDRPHRMYGYANSIPTEEGNKTFGSITGTDYKGRTIRGVYGTALPSGVVGITQVAIVFQGTTDVDWSTITINGNTYTRDGSTVVSTSGGLTTYVIGLGNPFGNNTGVIRSISIE